MRTFVYVVSTVVVLSLLVAGMAWWFWPASEDAQVIEVQELQRRLFEQRAAMTQQQRSEFFSELRNKMEGLSDEQREVVRRQGSEAFREQMAQRIRKFHEATPEQRTALLDAEINRMENMRREGGRRGGPPGPFPRPRPDGAGQSNRRDGGRDRRGRGLTEDERASRRRQRLDRTSARERAEFVAYIEALRQRREQRGLPDLGGPFGRR